MLDNNTKQFIVDLLQQNSRTDGRQCFQIREPQVLFFDNSGHILYKQGKTQIMVKIKAEITAPKPQRPSEGFIIFRVNCMACRGNFEENKKYANELSKLLEKVIIESNSLDPQSLCVLTGKYVWELTVNCIVVKDDGNIIDSVLNSVMVGLMDMKKPTTSIENSKVKLGNKQLSLSLAHTPFSFSFGFLNNTIYIDPIFQEEEISETRLTITMNIYKQICSVHKPGGKGISRNVLSGATRVCQNQIRKFTQNMRQVVKSRKLVRLCF